jgi:23S rRNA (cytidine2498-2'-O)-methyltransferase
MRERLSVEMPVERVIVTCSAHSETYARSEWRKAFPDSAAPASLAPGLFLSQTGLSFSETSAQLERSGSLFIRHLAPVQRESALRGDESDLESLCATALALAPFLDSGLPFAVQSRILAEGPLPYRRFILNQRLSDALSEVSGAVMDCREPQQVLSVLCTPKQGYMGISLARQNRSAWPGGEHRFKYEEEQISRSEFKLLEAISVFRLELPERGTALDMGAAPGGWTRVLRQRGLRVVAVDPAELDPRLQGVSNVDIVRRKVEEYLRRAPIFDFLANDMRMDTMDSVAVMVKASAVLKPGGVAVMTLKLPENAPDQVAALIRRALERLSTVYQIIGARQLYHNRSEVTAALQRRSA